MQTCSWARTSRKAWDPSSGYSIYFGQPVGRSGFSWNWNWSNALLYPLTLLGFKLWITWPGLAILGFIAALRFVPRTGERGMAGRFTITALVVTLATYLSYFWQAVRFLLVPTVLLNTVAAAVLIPWLLRLLERSNIRIELLHSRYRVRDRAHWARQRLGDPT